MVLANLDFQVDEEFDDMTLTQKKFEILKVGEFTDARYGKFEITEEKLLTLKKNFDDNVVKLDIALDLNHDPTGGAFAWINTLSVEGGKLFMTLKDITEEGRKILKQKVFKYFSVEFAPFDTIIDGKKATIKDVLRGVALTNRPVIKGMQPTFLSEDVNNSLNNQTMSFIVKLADDLLSRDKVTKQDAAFLRASLDEAPEEEKTDEVEEKVAEVEAKAEKAEADADEEEKSTKAEKAEGEEEEKADEVEAVKAAEVSVKLSEANTKIAKLEAKESQREVADCVKSLMLSEENKKGFSKDAYEDLSGFVATLSDEQREQFAKLVPKAVDATKLSEEIGSHEVGVSNTEDAKLAEAAKLAEVKVKGGMAADEAVREAQKEVGLGK